MTRCRWLLLAGDSNTREIMESIARRFAEEGFRDVHTWPPKHLTRINKLRPFNDASGAAQIGCQTKFFDQERVLARTGRRGDCVWLSLRFLLHAGEATRLLPSTWPPRQPFAHPVCNTQQWAPSRDPLRFWRCAERMHWSFNDTQSACCQRWRILQPCDGPPPEQQRPDVPDFVWLSSGLWHAPFSVRDTVLRRTQTPLASDHCASRFASELYTFARLRTYGVPFIWATIWPSDSNRRPWSSDTGNAYQRREVACQRSLAKSLSLPLMDLWSMVERQMLEAVPGDIHLTGAGYNGVVTNLLATSEGFRRAMGQRPRVEAPSQNVSGNLEAYLLGVDGEPLV